MRRANTTFDVYRAGSLPPADPDQAGLSGHLRDAWRRGHEANEGDRTFFWTATLEVPLSVNLPDAYPAGVGDTTIWVPDRNGQAYTVVFVERERGFRGRDFLRVYLIRGIAVSITIQELDATPSYTGVTTLLVDQADGFVLTQPAARQVRIDLQAATTTQAGIVSTSDQQVAGIKMFTQACRTTYIGFGPGAANNSYGGAQGIDSGSIGEGVGVGFFASAAGDSTTFSMGRTTRIVLLRSTGSTDNPSYAIYSNSGGGSIKTGAWGTDTLGNEISGGLVTTVSSSDITSLGTVTSGTWEADLISLAFGGTGASLVDPNADRLLFWDDSAGQVTWLEAGSGLSITGTTITSTGVSDGDKGDITVSSSGTVWTIDANVVSDAKFRQSSGCSLVGRSASTTGDVADITASADNQYLRRQSGALGFGTLPSASDTTPGLIEIATQAELETPSSSTLAVTPARVQHHPGVAKGWVYFDPSAATPTVHASHNVSSITDTATGRWSVVWDTDFSSATYAVSLSTEWDSGTAFYSIGIDGDVGLAAGSTPIACAIVGGGLADARHVHCVTWGDQA